MGRRKPSPALDPRCILMHTASSGSRSREHPVRTQPQDSTAATKDDTVAITVRLPSRVYEQLAKQAEDENRSVNQEAIRLIRYALADSDKLDRLAKQVKASENKV